MVLDETHNLRCHPPGQPNGGLTSLFFFIEEEKNSYPLSRTVDPVEVSARRRAGLLSEAKHQCLRLCLLLFPGIRD